MSFSSKCFSAAETKLLLLLLCACASAVFVEARVHHHKWEISYQFKSSDCYRKLAVTINGQTPGPTIVAEQGDTVVVEVKNSLLTENVAIHWHGIRQPGTYLYHAHYGMQRSAGLNGVIKVMVPKGVSEPFKYDHEHTILLNDWWHNSTYEQAVGLASVPFVFVGEPQSLLINGRGRFNCSLATSGTCNATNPECSPPVFTVVPGKTYRLRIASISSLSALSFEIEGHNLTVVEADGHYVDPFVVQNLYIYSGETYSVLLKADRDPTRNYWAASNVGLRHTRTPKNPNATTSNAIYRVGFGSTVDVVLQNANTLTPNNSETHPWHLHGHDFWVLGYGSGKYNPGADPGSYNLRDPIMKNTVALHPMGWTALRFRADNPGVWAFHCHIESHFFMGMGIVFEEGVEKVGRLPESILGCVEKLGSLLHHCSKLKSLSHGASLHSALIKSGVEHDLFLSNHLLNMYAKCGKLEHAHKMFDEMPRRNLVSFSALISGYDQSGEPLMALNLFSQLEFDPNEYIYGSVLSACATLLALSQGKQVHADVIKTGFFDVSFVSNSLISMYMKCSCFHEAYSIFGTIAEPNSVSYNAMIAGFAENGHVENSLELFRLMNQRGLRPDQFSYVAVVGICTSKKDLDTGVGFHCQSIKLGLDITAFVGNVILTMYSKSGSIEEVEKMTFFSYNMRNSFTYRHSFIQILFVINSVSNSDTLLYAFPLIYLYDL
uniref:L-ascorbate oxidase n=1 Tax=Ananas comosus var. bracteatus TaxID=296719 RepID=A0A6V7P2Z4_ANACO|nr:unnamed protein product [Ananas comosus var. bracteatus]